MTSERIQALINEAGCLNCSVQGMELSILIILAAKAAGIDPNPGTLIDMAKCINCNIPEGMRLAVIIAILDELSE